MKKLFLVLAVLFVGGIVAISVSEFIGKAPDSTLIAQQREWLGGIALKMTIVRVVIISGMLVLATFVYIDKTANYFRTNRTVITKTRMRLMFWYLAFELVFILAYLR